MKYFEAEVKLSSSGLWSTKYILDDKCVLKVKNSNHIRMINQARTPWPEKFKILAPMDAVSLVEGEISKKYISNRTDMYYSRMKELWEKPF